VYRRTAQVEGLSVKGYFFSTMSALRLETVSTSFYFLSGTLKLSSGSKANVF